jgi:hypothetical protein
MSKFALKLNLDANSLIVTILTKDLLSFLIMFTLNTMNNLRNP